MKKIYMTILPNGELIYEGVIYVYTLNATKQPYVGSTTYEKKRRYSWNSTKHPYGGPKIENARKIHGISLKTTWTYGQLEIIREKDIATFLSKLKEREVYWIK